MLLFVYRSIITVILLLLTVGIELAAARGAVAVLGHYRSYRTFHLRGQPAHVAGHRGRYRLRDLHHRALPGSPSGRRGQEAAFYTMYRGTAHVILGSGLTIAGATFCLSFARMPYFETLGIPCAVGMLMAVAVALTLGPAVLTVGSRFGLFDPKRKMRGSGLATGRHRGGPLAAARSSPPPAPSPWSAC